MMRRRKPGFVSVEQKPLFGPEPHKAAVSHEVAPPQAARLAPEPEQPFETGALHPQRGALYKAADMIKAAPDAKGKSSRGACQIRIYPNLPAARAHPPKYYIRPPLPYPPS